MVSKRRKTSLVAAAAGENHQTKANTDEWKRPHVYCMVEVAGGGVLGAIVLSIYVRTLYPSIAGGDSGELVAESCQLGIAHPPGYPLYTMLVHLFTTYLPDKQSRAWKANFFSAVCDALATQMLYFSILHWTKSTNAKYRLAPAFTSAGLFALSPLIWTYAIGAEVFALNNLFTALLIYLCLQYASTRSASKAVQGAFVCGLALCNQHTIILFEIPLIVWVISSVTRSDDRPLRSIGCCALAFFVGLLPTLYLPISAHFDPVAGSWGDLTSVKGVLHHLRRADYGTFRLFATDNPTESLATRLRLYVLDLATNQSPYYSAIVLGCIGMVSTLVQRKANPSRRAKKTNMTTTGAIFFVTYIFYMVVFHALSNLPLDEGLTYGVHLRFWQQPNVFVFYWVGIGLTHALNVKALDRVDSLQIGRTLLCLAILSNQLSSWYDDTDRSEAWYIYNYGRALLEPLPKGAVLFAGYDLQWTSLRYLQQCEQVRPDVTLLSMTMMTYKWFNTKHDDYPNITFPSGALSQHGRQVDRFTLSDFVYANLPRRSHEKKDRKRVFFGSKPPFHDPEFNSKFTLIPYGLVDEVRDNRWDPLPLAKWYSSQQRVQKLIHQWLNELPPTYKYNDETWEWTIARDYGMKATSWSTHLLDRTMDESPTNLALIVQSTYALEATYQYEPRTFWSPVSLLKNLGFAYAQIVKSDQDFSDIQTQVPPILAHVNNTPVVSTTKYKDFATQRMLQLWREWVETPGAKDDPGYKAIYNIVSRFQSTD